MPDRERFLELDLAGVGGAPAEKVRLGLRFTERARYAWETRGYRLPSKAELLRGRTAELKQLLWACLEGFRDYNAEKRVPWTMDAVNDLVERAGGWKGAMTTQCLGAFTAAGPPDEEEAGEAAQGKAAPTGEAPSEPRSATA